jgi:hypothetical protein
MTDPEEKTPWLRLAQLSEDHEENKQLWNGYQKYLLKPYAEDYQRQMENPKFAAIAELSDTTIHAIQTKIQDLPTELGQYDPINMAAGVPEIKMPLNLEGFYFAFPVWLMGLRFKESLNLDNAQFSYGAHFTGCVFEKHLWARESNFERNAGFADCKFNEGSSFHSATFEFADFRSANFEGHNNFEKARFTSDVLFEDALFSSSVCFEAAEFHASVNFNWAKSPIPAVPLDFNGAKFINHPPSFFGREMHEDTNWTDVEWPSAKQLAAQHRQSLEYDKRAYEQLRIKCGALGKVEDAHLFFRREMDLTGRLSPWSTRVTYWLYGLVSDYGHSYWRPIVGLAGVWALWSGLYALYFMSVGKLHLGMDRMDLALSITGLSFANIFAVFGFHRRFPSDLLADPGTGAILLTASETLLGFVFLFFLGLGLRTRFRLR